MPAIDKISLKNKAENNKATLFFCTAATFIWGLAAHGYMFFNNSFSHDSLNEFYAKIYGNDIRIAYGRIFVPLYRSIARSSIALPWLIGILALIYISLTVFLVVKMFRVKSKFQQAVIAGIFTVNITVIATTATYIHDLDCDMLALLLATAAAFLWKYNEKYGFLIGAPFVMLSLGFYQSYVSVTISLVIIYLILALLDCEKFKKVMILGIKAVGMIIIGGLLYAVAIKFVSFITDISLAEGDSTSLDNVAEFSLSNAASLVSRGVKNMVPKLLIPKSIYSDILCMIVSITIFVIAIVLLIKAILNKAVGIKEAVLTIILVALLPVGMNISYVLSNGRTHDVMLYSYWLFYLLILLIDRFTISKTLILSNFRKGVSTALIAGILLISWGNVQTANAVYLKKNFEYDANLSFFTRVVSDMEECKAYIPGETPVVILGRPNESLIPSPAFEDANEYTGARSNFTLGVATWDYYKAYFGYVLMNPAVMADKKDWSKLKYNTIVKRMPSYPEEGSIKIVKGTLVVKLG